MGFFDGLSALGSLAKLALAVLDYLGIRDTNMNKFLADVVSAQITQRPPTQPSDDEAAQESELERQRRESQPKP